MGQAIPTRLLTAWALFIVGGGVSLVACALSEEGDCSGFSCVDGSPNDPPSDATVDGASDATFDRGFDAAFDRGPYAKLDGAPDATFDSTPEATFDSGIDALVDVAGDASIDAPSDSVSDAPQDAPGDAIGDAGQPIECSGPGDCPIGQACDVSTGFCTTACSSTSACNGGCCN